jgi:pSer/pThr/pTyr-binding forkhead associated (FHA) protein
MAWLILHYPGIDLIAHKLPGDVITIGRVPSNHIVIDNQTVSVQHAILARLDDSYRLKDLNSTNGTQVNGIGITDAELKDGDRIRFGHVAAFFLRGPDEGRDSLNRGKVLLAGEPDQVKTRF